MAGLTEVKGITARLKDIRDELEDIAECAEDCRRTAVNHKCEEVMGRLHEAIRASEQYDHGILHSDA